MQWRSVEDHLSVQELPAGYRLAQIRPGEVDELVALLAQWFPEIAVGAASCYLHPGFYRREVLFEDQPQRHVLLILIKQGAAIVGMMAFRQNADTLTLKSELGAVAPEHRGAGLAGVGNALLESVGRLLGMAMVQFNASLRMLQMQRAAERAGYVLAGIIPAADRDMVAPGCARHVYEALYVKVLADTDQLLPPDRSLFTPQTRAVFDALFGGPEAASAV